MFGASRCGDNKEMQDAIAYTDHVGIIADGHGDQGAAIAQYASAYAMKHMSALDYSYDPERFYEEMPALFREIHESYRSKYNHTISGGTTLTIMFHGTFQGRTYIMTANVGDTEVLLFRENDIIELTTVHDPLSEEEYHRIQRRGIEAGHFVYQTSGAETVGGHLSVFEPDGTRSVYTDTYTPYRDAIHAHQVAYQAAMTAKSNGLPYQELLPAIKLAKQRYDTALYAYQHSPDGRRNPSTVRGDRGAYLMKDSMDQPLRYAVTRSIGNYAAESIGMSCEPSVHIEWIQTKSIVFMASDGILDAYRFDELAQIVASTTTELLDRFYAHAKQHFQERDDMSFIMKHIM